MMAINDSPVSVYTLFSSSSGNCIFVTDGQTRFLIDAGCSMKRISDALGSLGCSLSDISDIFVTHEHTDHVSALSRICSNYKMNIRAAAPTAEKLGVPGVICVTEGKQTRIGSFAVTAFRLSHDTSYCVGYTVRHESGVSFAEMTDTGCVTEEAKNALCGVGAVILESNYDDNMLINGGYPYDVKQRIRSANGHLSNDQAAEFLPYLYKYGTRRVLLAHISKENNTKEKAYGRACRAVSENGLDGLFVACADRLCVTRLI